MDVSRTIFINGRFLLAPPTGVQRTAREIVRALDADLAARPGSCDWRLLAPPGSGVEEMAQWPRLRPGIAEGPLRGQLWEQVTLAGAAKGGALVSLANTAPVSHPRNIVMLHDAQVHDTPASYSGAFRAWYGWLWPRLTKKAEAVLTVSRFSAERLAHHGVAARDRIQIVSNGVDHVLRVAPDASVLAKHGLAPQRYVLGFASAQVHKNAKLLVDLFAEPRADGLVLALVGSNLPEGVSLPPGAKLLGKASDGELRALYENAFAFLAPSTTEGFGLPAGEAMILGCPAIVSAAGAQMEVWGEAALLAPPTDVEAWREHLDRLSADAKLRAARAAKGREIAARFTWEKAARKLRMIAEGPLAPT
jgi:glycosyltransferase involved in cell wall biosynthesis